MQYKCEFALWRRLHRLKMKATLSFTRTYDNGKYQFSLNKNGIRSSTGRQKWKSNQLYALKIQNQGPIRVIMVLVSSLDQELQKSLDHGRITSQKCPANPAVYFMQTFQGEVRDLQLQVVCSDHHSRLVGCIELQRSHIGEVSVR